MIIILQKRQKMGTFAGEEEEEEEEENHFILILFDFSR
jgi:hypothetical protein